MIKTANYYKNSKIYREGVSVSIQTFNSENKIRKLLEAIKNTKVKNLIFSSTCAVYKDGFTKVTEKTKLDPSSVYGRTKLKCEKLIKLFCKKNKINFGILRYFNVAGASASGKIYL